MTTLLLLPSRHLFKIPLEYNRFFVQMCLLSLVPRQDNNSLIRLERGSFISGSTTNMQVPLTTLDTIGDNPRSMILIRLEERGSVIISGSTTNMATSIDHPLDTIEDIPRSMICRCRRLLSEGQFFFGLFLLLLLLLLLG